MHEVTYHIIERVFHLKSEYYDSNAKKSGKRVDRLVFPLMKIDYLVLTNKIHLNNV